MSIVTKPVVETISVSTSLAEKGLCETCAQAPGCVFLKASHRPVWYCEEFDEQTPVITGFTAPAVPKPHTNGNGNGNGHAQGLCANCEARKECTYRVPGRAVFECEEYV